MLGGGGNLGLNFTGVRGAQRSTEVRVTWNLGPSIFLVRKKYWRELTSGPPTSEFRWRRSVSFDGNGVLVAESE